MTPPSLSKHSRSFFSHPMLLRAARTVASFALLGAVSFGAFLSWLPMAFDVHLPGALLGAVVGVAALRKPCPLSNSDRP